MFGVITLLAILLVVADLALQGAVKNTARTGFHYAATAVSDSASFIALSGVFSSKQTLEEENARLKNEIVRLSNLQFTNRVLQAENKTLRELLDVVGNNPAGVTARVTVPLSASPYGTFLVGAGRSDGVEEGAYVVAGESIAIGFISEAGDTTSLVSLFLAPGREVHVTLGDDVALDLTGRGVGNATVAVPRGTPVAVGDIVYIAGTSYIAGVVGHIEVSPADPIQTVYISSPLSLSTLSFVHITNAHTLHTRAVEDTPVDDE